MSNKKRISKKRAQLRKRLKPHFVIDIETCDFGFGKDFAIMVAAYIDDNDNMRYLDLDRSDEYIKDVELRM